MKYEEKAQTKSAKTAISGIFPAFLAGKKFFSKIRLGHVLSIVNTRFCAKKSEKTNGKISRKCQKTGFSGIFPTFSAGKICFSKIGLGHILDITILHQCAKFHEKILSTAREIQEILFSSIFRQFWLQRSVFLTIETCLMVGIAILRNATLYL